eukprot:CAMPEP_0171087302 /NCGR_PEP_ID=MMETSP0766_2-20121228/20059_1 /TAXON_ID=439317 /ORGANISM="Gambierdiscus australes, Strain CAWD 149" /LENGTH=1150 /DNA_ID=CAMNT_0011544997 /DNA_START=39 /DNA_END=3491 /DNA_ORIENTATION=+
MLATSRLWVLPIEVLVVLLCLCIHSLQAAFDHVGEADLQALVQTGFEVTSTLVDADPTVADASAAGEAPEAGQSNIVDAPGSSAEITNSAEQGKVSEDGAIAITGAPDTEADMKPQQFTPFGDADDNHEEEDKLLKKRFKSTKAKIQEIKFPEPRPYAQDRWFDIRRNQHVTKRQVRGRKKQDQVAVGAPVKLDTWGRISQPKRARFLLPVACLVFPGTIFALFHLHRSPWHPPKTPDEPVKVLRPRRSSTMLTSQTRLDRITGSSVPSDGGHEGDSSAKEEVEGCPGKAPPLRRRKTEYGFVDKMFLKHWNRSFGDNAQLTVRGAAYALIAGLPLIMPETSFPSLQQFQSTGFWSVGAITLFIFTLWKSVGETLAFSWSGIFGTFIASLDIWLMFGLFPGGVSEISSPLVFWVGIVNGVLFVTIIMWLNVDDNTKIFSLMNFVWFWMAFMDPDRAELFSQGWGVTARSSEVSSVLAAISGSGLAITATLLPFPLWALGKACRSSHEIVAKMGAIWANTVDTYCEMGSAFENDRLVHELMELQRRMDTVKSDIRNSWWECFGLGWWQRVRLMLTRLTIMLHDDFDRLYCVLNATLNASQSRGVKEENQVTAELEDRIRRVVSEAQWLLQHSAVAACRGGFTSQDETQAAKRGIERVNEAICTLTLNFRELKQEGGGPKLSEGLMDEHALCYNICALGRLSIRFTQDILKCQDTIEHMPKIKESVGISGVFDNEVLFDMGHLLYVARTSMRILVCFFLGYHGYSNVVRGKNAGIAVPATLLLMRYSGSAIQKNAKRLQAVVFGTVTGILVHAMVGRCIWWGYALTGFFFFSWLLLTLFLYFDSVDNSYNGLLMAYFGTMGILRGCNDISFDPALTHYPITNTVVAIFVVTFFDIVFHPGRAAVAAYEAYVEVWRTMKEAVTAIFDPNVKKVEFHREKIMQMVVAAEQLGREAAIEPRWWRVPWPEAVYEKAIQSSFQLCACMSNMEHTVARAGRDGAAKDEVFEALLHVSGFQGVGAVLLAKMNQMEKLLKIFVHETTGPMPELEVPALMVGYLRDETEARKKFLEQVCEMENQCISGFEAMTQSSPSRSTQPRENPKDSIIRATLKRRLSYNFQVDSLEADPASQVSLLLSDIEQMIRTMRSLHHTILRS